jgi:hypothetical protein
MHQAQCSEEIMMYHGMLQRAGSIFADNQRRAAVSINVVRAILRIVFEDEDGRVVPVRAMRDGIH